MRIFELFKKGGKLSCLVLLYYFIHTIQNYLQCAKNKRGALVSEHGALVSEAHRSMAGSTERPIEAGQARLTDPKIVAQ